MHELTQLIYDDMKPALGVTEPGAIAFAVAQAREFLEGEAASPQGRGGRIRRVHVAMNSGMYKNAFTCGIPNSPEVGNVFAAALGAVAGDARLGLEALKDVTEGDNETARQLIRDGKVTVSLSGIDSRIFIEATVETPAGTATVTIRDSHTNITGVLVNGQPYPGWPVDRGGNGKTEQDRAESLRETLPDENGDPSATVSKDTAASADASGSPCAPKDGAPVIHRYTLQEICDYVSGVDESELQFIAKAYDMNLSLFEEGLESPRTTFAPYLLKKNGGKILSDDAQRTASLLCNAAIEARVIGLTRPAMSITGSGAHGIIATLPLYAAYKVNGGSREQLLRATALSYLVCMYIKEYSGRLSAFCGCAIAAGSGMACGLIYLRGGTPKEMAYALNNMASGITGMICDGGNQGCTMKGIAAVDAAFQSAELAMAGVCVDSVHGINGATPEETMRNMGRIASPGMVGTERTIVEIFEEKLAERQGRGTECR